MDLEGSISEVRYEHFARWQNAGAHKAAASQEPHIVAAKAKAVRKVPWAAQDVVHTHAASNAAHPRRGNSRTALS